MKYGGKRMAEAFRTVRKNTIILAKGVSGEVVAEGDGYKATNRAADGKTTDYIVTKNSFKIVQSSGGTTVGEVTKFYTP